MIRVEKCIRRLRIYRNGIAEVTQFFSNVGRCVSGACQQEGVEFRYLALVSDSKPHGEVGSARVHIHMVCNCEAAEIVAQKWGKMGDVKIKKLHKEACDGVFDLTQLAAYMVGQSRVVDGKKRYTVSRNMAGPLPVEDELVDPSEEITNPPGTVLIARRAGSRTQVRYFNPPGHAAGGGGT